MKKALLSFALLAAVLSSFDAPVRADVANITTGMFSSTAASGSFPVLNLNGQQTCTLSLVHGGGATFVVNGASDTAPTYVVNPTFPNGGTFTGTDATTYSGNVSGLNASINVTWSSNTATVQGTISCTGAGGSSSTTTLANSSVTVSNYAQFPTPMPAPTDASGGIKTGCDGVSCGPPIAWTNASPEPALMEGQTASGGTYKPVPFCVNTTPISISATGTTTLIALTAGTNVRICSWYVQVISGTNPAFAFVDGTTANCTSVLDTLTGTFTGVGLYGQSSFPEVFQAQTQAANLCISVSGTSPVLAGYISWAKI